MDFFLDHTLRVVAMGSGALGAAAGALGSFAVLRRQSMLGDALSHAALPGIALAFLLTSSKAPLVLLAGAGVAGWIATLAVNRIVKHSRVPYDSALGLVLSVFFGGGLVLLTYIQKQPDASQAGLDSFLFGQAAAQLESDLVLTAVLGAFALVLLVLVWKEMKLLSFDPEFGASLGIKMGRVDALLTGLLVIAVVIGLQTVGVVLMSAMIVAPAAAARQWTEKLGPMVVIAAVFGSVSGIAGATISSLVDRMPTGPTIVLVLSVVVLISLLAAPQRGLLWRKIRLGRLRRAPSLNPVLMHLYALALQHVDNPEHGHPVAVLKTMSSADVDVEAALEGLERQGLAMQTAAGAWAPTSIGRREARRIFEREGAPDEA